ncbi:hypothetical protein ASC66_08120 [Leifsonia sp. Root4]|uniref:helicase associated domain-containing protein n=1 Tax=Leifsonia sp. Root4 TaxID=1736525 RepID=UPI0006FA955F|nr:helicase associated domain-containing protein [Leifsonia sp. Root4]KQW06443.1 hypothetical protein ASC66_08120 [Leifsonia sp. Root4]
MQQAGIAPAELYERARDIFEATSREADEEPQERSSLYERADHAIATTGEAPRAPGLRRAANWASALHRYETFWRENGRTPRENTRDQSTLPAAERRLGEWARHQRRFDDMLCVYQRIRLEVSPAFAWDSLEDLWQAHLLACAAHREQVGDLPRLHATDAVEFALARWLGRQLRRLKAGTLPEHRVALLTELLAATAPEAENPIQ